MAKTIYAFQFNRITPELFKFINELDSGSADFELVEITAIRPFIEVAFKMESVPDIYYNNFIDRFEDLWIT